MQYLQETAARHAVQLGVGRADLDRRDCFWVLVNLRIEMIATPRWEDRVTIRTWPSGCTRLLASREFLGIDPAGRELFRATSDWMILDQQSSRPQNLERLDLHLPHAGPKVLSALLGRLRPADAYATAGTLSVPFSALDFNGHVNNTEYVRWALDALHGTLGRCPHLRALQMTYTAEVFEDDQIEILVAAGDTPLRILERKAGAATNTNAFLMELEE
jgi:acyl-ACP thioesterase